MDNEASKKPEHESKEEAGSETNATAPKKRPIFVRAEDAAAREPVVGTASVRSPPPRAAFYRADLMCATRVAFAANL